MSDIKVHILPHFRGEDKGDGGIRRVVEAQIKYLPEFGVHVVPNMANADVLAVHAGNWADFDGPVVHHCHGLYWNEYEWPRWALDLNEHVVASIRKADVTTAPSEWVAQVLRRAFWVDAIPLVHGVDSNEWQPSLQNDGYVLWNKNRVDPICDPTPMQMLAEKASGVKFVSTYGQSDANVDIVGVKSYEKAKEFVEHAGVYLCTTRETFGIGTLEAMACGVPVLAWNWGGQREFVVHKENGYLAQPGNIEELYEGLMYILSNRERMSLAARDTAKMFTWENAMKQYAILYEELYYNKHEGPKISVIIPCYNLAQYLTDAVTSVLAQSEQDFEIIIVDDASPDDTSVLAERLASSDDRIRVIHNPTNLYLAGALNAGIEQARGKYILPLDADNMLDRDTLRTLGNALDGNSDIDIAYGAVKFVELDGVTPDRQVSGNGISTWPRDFIFDNQMRHWNQCPSTSLYRKQVWKRSGGYRVRCRTAEDADFWTRVSSLGFKPAKVTEAVTLIYRQREDSMSRVNQDWDWTAWFPWSRLNHLTPPGVNPHNISTYEPPLISVIIPVGPNHTEKVIDAVDSLIAQTFQKWECILVNDSGRDLHWIHPFVTVIDSSGESVNRIARARNQGIKASNAKLFVLLDADDYLQPDALQEFYDAYQKYHGYIYSDWLVHETGDLHTTAEFDKYAVLQTMPHAVTCLYEKKQWLEVGGFDENIPGWEDWDFIIAITMQGYCGSRVAKPLLQYRMQEGTTREDNYARQEEIKAAVYEKWQEYIDGRKFPMACGGCGQRQVPAPPTYSPQIARVEDEDMVLIEFSGSSAPRTFTGAKTGTNYRFGNDREHRIRYVHKDDAEVLLLRPEFRKYSEDLVVLR